MKKYTAFILITIVIFMLLCGCKGGEGQPEVFTGEKLGEYENFYLIDEKTYDELDMVKLQYSDGCILFTVRNYLSGDVELFSYDVFSGKFSEPISAKTAFALNFKTGFLPDGNIYSFDCTSNSLIFYNTKLEETKKTNFLNINVDEIYIDNDFALYIDGVNLYRVDLSDKNTVLCGSFPNLLAESFKFYGRNADMIFLSGYNDEGVDNLISYDINSGECKDYGELDGKIIIGDSLLSYSHTDNGVTDVFDSQKPNAVTSIMPISDLEELTGAGNGKVCTSFCTGEDSVITQTLRIYSLDGGNKVAEAKYVFDVSDMYECIHEVYIINDDFAIMELRQNNVHRFVLWKYSDDLTEITERSPLMFDSEKDTVSAENKNLMTYIFDKYRIEVLTGDDAVIYYPNYVVASVYDEKIVNSALKKVISVLEKIPDGFFTELCEKSIYDDKIQLAFCGKIKPSDSYGLDNTIGFSKVYDNTQIIALNILESDLERTFSHEVMHITEEYIKSKSKDAFSMWNNFLPEGFSYRNSYRNENGEPYTPYDLYKYTPDDSESLKDINNVYFVDYYSQTFASEDRCRIFEYLMQDEIPQFFESENLEKKAEYLCKCIRDNFEAVRLTDNVYWEKFFK